MVCLRDKVTIEHIGNPIYRMVPLSMTLSDLYSDFKVTTFFDIEYLIKDTR